jgi:hypothetical protein
MACTVAPPATRSTTSGEKARKEGVELGQPVLWDINDDLLVASGGVRFLIQFLLLYLLMFESIAQVDIEVNT